MSTSEGAGFEPETCAWCGGGGHGRDGRACGVCRGPGWEGTHLPRESVTGDNVREMFERFHRGG